MPVLDIGLRRPTLDDVFLSLTGHAAASAPPDADRTHDDHTHDHTQEREADA